MNTAVKIPFKRKFSMFSVWGGEKLKAQAKAVAFIVIYLIIAQTLVLKQPIYKPLSIGLGILATVFGLAFFLEGLFLGVMPLGERCGLKLPGKASPALIAGFGLVLGVTATLAEPAIGILKLQGGTAKPWSAPLLFLLLNRGSSWLVAAIAIGVGMAVIIGIFRFLYKWSLKPFLFITMPILIILTFFFEANPNLKTILGLAWDTGGVTTGPVTVPLIIALGLGVSRIVGSKNDSSGGLGVVTLASTLPAVAVFTLSIILLPMVPQPSTALEFFSASNREKALFIAGSEVELENIAHEAMLSGALASSDFIEFFPNKSLAVESESINKNDSIFRRIISNALDALKAVIPLALVLIVTLVFLLKDKLLNSDEMILGLVFAVFGLFLFSFGMEKGLSELGTQLGTNLPRAYAKTERNDKAITLHGVTEESVFTAAGTEGQEKYIWMQNNNGPVAIPFDTTKLNKETKTYSYVPIENAVFENFGKYGGLIAALLFVFILGFGATLAEPSLAALGVTVEDLTTGTYKSSFLISTVAVGVGVGMAAGFSTILFNLSFAWILGIPYAIALILTAFAPEDFAAIAWDSGGVTTGPITVPLVIATGLGIGGVSGSASSFGVVATSCIFPVVAVLSTGLWKAHKTKVSLLSSGEASR